jgi:hypothetical protein
MTPQEKGQFAGVSPELDRADRELSTGPAPAQLSARTMKRLATVGHGCPARPRKNGHY